ncbi:MAG: RHS repeat-associated core domain-containing protein, partial [Actinomycetota bacterium]
EQLAWSGPAGSIATDAVIYSSSGRIKDQTIDGADAGAGVDNFVYDAAGSLTTARVPGQTHTYSFANDPGCAVVNAGANTNRTSTTVNGGAATTYCYDAADRLVSTSDSRYSAPAYDGHGNTTTLGTQTMKYDGADRHVETKAGTEPTVRYVRDAADRIVERKVGGTVVARYGYSAAGDTADLTLDASGTVIERLYPLVGSVLLTKRGSGDVWSYPNIHGDVIATANSAGAKQGSTMHYGPFGQVLGATPDNSADDLDYGWLGQHQRPLEHEGSLATIEMGARQYAPGLGRFLEVDSVEGGSANDYEYVGGDPVNGLDLDGNRCV